MSLGAALGRLTWNPIVAKEVRSRMRTWRAGAVLAGYLAVVGAVGYTAYVHLVDTTTDVRSLGQAGRSVFAALAATVLALMALLVPGLVGSAVSGERERQTLDLLLCTPVRPARIVAGKLASSLLFVMVLLAASVPLFSAVFLLGGVSVAEVLELTLVVVVAVVAMGSAAMLCSVVLRRSTSSTVTSYLAAFLLFVGPFVVGSVLTRTTPYNGGAVPSIVPSVVPVPSPVPSLAPAATVPAIAPSVGLPSVPGLAVPLQAIPTRVDPPLVELVSPITAMAATLDTSNGPCGAPGFLGIGSPVSCLGPPGSAPPDQLAGGLFAGWREWQVFVLLDGALAALALAASIAVLGGGIPLGRISRTGPPPPSPPSSP